jgi:hypothetical protein
MGRVHNIIRRTEEYIYMYLYCVYEVGVRYTGRKTFGVYIVLKVVGSDVQGVENTQHTHTHTHTTHRGKGALVTCGHASTE